MRKCSPSIPTSQRSPIPQAYVLSEIAHADWPDEYPTLMEQLLKLLEEGSSDGVHGAMRVLTEFVRSDLSEAQLLPLAREMLPKLLTILGSPDVSFVSL